MIDSTLVDFVKALRTAELKVSPAETLDAMQAMDIVGYEDREFLKNTLSIVLAKNPEEKEAFDTCFENYFSFDNFQDSEKGSRANHNNEFDYDGEFDSDKNPHNAGKSSGQGMGQGGGGREEDGIDLEPTSPLGKILLSGDKTELMIAMAEAGRKVQVNQIVVFTQKGLYTRKIMDAMGLAELQQEIADLQSTGGVPRLNLASKLNRARDRLRDTVRDYVEKQFFLHTRLTFPP